MSEKTPRDLLSIATGQDWAQIGSRYIARCDNPGQANDIVRGLRKFGLQDAQITGMNAVQVSVSAQQPLNEQIAHNIRDYMSDGVDTSTPQKAGRAR